MICYHDKVVVARGFYTGCKGVVVAECRGPFGWWSEYMVRFDGSIDFKWFRAKFLKVTGHA